MKSKSIIIFLSIMSILFYSCFPKDNENRDLPDNAEQDLPDSNDEPVIETKYPKVEIKDGLLLYHRIEPQIEDMDEFFSMYTDEELLAVTFLDFTLNKITVIEGLERLPNIEILALDSNLIEKIEGINQLDKLRILGLARNNITIIENLNNLSNLRELYLNENPLEDISGLLALRNIEKINIAGYYDLTDEILNNWDKFLENNPDIERWTLR